MTRMPAPHRLHPGVAYELLHQSFKDCRVAALGSQRIWRFLGDCVAAETAGGRTYDAMIAAIAVESGAREILTFNPRDFEAFADRLSIVVP